MNENDNNFESVRRALALKRHEVPPPGYFNNFSGEVIARIRSGEAKSQDGSVPWLMKFLQSFETKPAFAGAFASVLCVLLLFGIIYAERPDGNEMTQSLMPNASSPAISPLASLSSADLMPAANQGGLVASTNPATSLQPVASLFSQQNPLAQQVSFSLPGN
ncbi:MAG: hypothetical protein WDM76_05585 [Limisphaerales bacterium]